MISAKNTIYSSIFSPKSRFIQLILDNQRSMADELFNDNIASEMAIGEVIVRGAKKDA